MKQIYYFASTYGEGDYNSQTYSGCTTNAQTGVCEPTQASGGNVLVNTGTGILIAVTLAVTIIFISLVIRFFRKPSKQAPNPDRGEQSVDNNKHLTL
jgi:hypothetical protein